MRDSKETARQVVCGGQLALFFFAFLQSELLFDNAMVPLVGERGVILAQAAILATSAIGFVLYPVLAQAARRAGHATGAARAVALAAAPAGTLLLTLALRLEDAKPAIALGCLSFLLLGLGGARAHRLAVWARAEKHAGAMAGLSYAGGLLLQFAANAAPMPDEWFGMPVVAAAVVGCLLGHRLDGHKAEEGEAAPKAASLQARRNGLSPTVTTVLLVGLMTCIFSTLDNIVTVAHAGGDINVVASPRLVLAASGAVAGLLFDACGRRAAALATFCSALAATIVLLIAQSGGSMALALVIFYVSAGVFATFFTSEFLHLAGSSSHPDLWAGMGRGENNLVAAIFALPSLALMDTGDAVLIMAVALGLLCLTAVAAALHMRALGEKDLPAAEPTPAPSLEERTAAIAAAHGLTPRETDVLLAVVSDEKTLAATADDLGISLRMVQRHLTSIYKKTGTSSRAGLVRLTSR